MKKIIILVTSSYYTCNPSSSRWHTLYRLHWARWWYSYAESGWFWATTHGSRWENEVDGGILGPQTFPLFKLIPIWCHCIWLLLSHWFSHVIVFCLILSPNVDEMDTPDVRYVIHKGRVIQQQPPIVARPFESDATWEEIRWENDKILRQLQST